jgi:hypothetical protein
MHPTCAALAEAGRYHDPVFVAGMTYSALSFRSSTGVEIVHLIVGVVIGIVAIHFWLEFGCADFILSETQIWKNDWSPQLSL